MADYTQVSAPLGAHALAVIAQCNRETYARLRAAQAPYATTSRPVAMNRAVHTRADPESFMATLHISRFIHKLERRPGGRTDPVALELALSVAYKAGFAAAQSGRQAKLLHRARGLRGDLAHGVARR